MFCFSSGSSSSSLACLPSLQLLDRLEDFQKNHISRDQDFGIAPIRIVPVSQFCHFSGDKNVCCSLSHAPKSSLLITDIHVKQLLRKFPYFFTLISYNLIKIFLSEKFLYHRNFASHSQTPHIKPFFTLFCHHWTVLNCTFILCVVHVMRTNVGPDWKVVRWLMYSCGNQILSWFLFTLGLTVTCLKILNFFTPW